MKTVLEAMEMKDNRIFCDKLLEFVKMCGMIKYLIKFELGGHSDEAHPLCVLWNGLYR